MQALIFVHKDDVDKANEIVEKFAGPQAKNTFSVVYDKEWFVACWTMKSNLYNELKDAGLCVTNYKQAEEELIKKEVEEQISKGEFINKNEIQIDTKSILSSFTKERIQIKAEEKPIEEPKEEQKEEPVGDKI